MFNEEPRSAAKRRFNRRNNLTMLSFVVIMMACTTVARTHGVTGAALVVLSLLPAIPLVICIALIRAYLREERDEYIRSQSMDAMIGGLCMTFTITTIWGFLESAAAIAHFKTVLALPLWCFCTSVWQYGHGRIDREQADRT